MQVNLAVILSPILNLNTVIVDESANNPGIKFNLNLILLKTILFLYSPLIKTLKIYDLNV